MLINSIKNKIDRYDFTYLKIAQQLSSLSYDRDTKVGCIIVKNNSIIAEGFNGMPSGMPNECKDHNGKTNPEVLHAETNAIAKLCKNTVSSENATLYTTLSPCFDCAKIIYQAGIKRVVFLDMYKNKEGIEFLEKLNVEIVNFKYKLEE